MAVGSCFIGQGAQLSTLWWPRGVGWGVGGKLKREGICLVSFRPSVLSDSCDPMDYNPPGSSAYGISQARIREWVAISFSRESSRPRNRTQVSCIAGGFFTDWTMREALTSCECSLFLCQLHGFSEGKDSFFLFTVPHLSNPSKLLMKLILSIQ